MTEDITLASAEAVIQAREGEFSDIRPGLEKEIIWADTPNTQTEYALLYIHGFSASKGEIRPVPERIAEALHANLFYTRLPGHGRSEAAMGRTKVEEWYDTLDEAMAIGRVIGRKIIIISCSTGGTLKAAGFLRPERFKNTHAMVFLSPNFGIQNPFAWISRLPFAEYWIHLFLGRRIGFTPRNELNARFWTTQYPPRAVKPMLALIKDALRAPVDQASIPALFIYSKDDKIVSIAKTQAFHTKWGGPVKIIHPILQERDDPDAHVICGDALSPSQNTPIVNQILNFVENYADSLQ